MECEDHFWPISNVPSEQCPTCLRSPSCTTKDTFFDRIPTELQTCVCALADGAALKVFRQLNTRYHKVATPQLFSTLVIDEARLDHIEESSSLNDRGFRTYVSTLILDLPRNPAELIGDGEEEAEAYAERSIAARQRVVESLLTTWPRLFRLEISGLLIFDPEPAKLVLNQSATLRHLKLKDIKFTWLMLPIDAGPNPALFVTFFRTLHGYMRLETVSLEGVMCNNFFNGEEWEAMTENEMQLADTEPYFPAKLDTEVCFKRRLERYICRRGDDPFPVGRPLGFDETDDSWEPMHPDRYRHECPWFFRTGEQTY